MVGNDQYAINLIGADIKSNHKGLNAGCDDGSFFPAGDDDVSTTSLCDNDCVDMSYEVMHSIPMMGALESMLGPPEITNENGIINDTIVPLPTNNNKDYHCPRPPKGKSIVHFHHNQGSVLLFHLMLKQGGSVWHCANVSPDFLF